MAETDLKARALLRQLGYLAVSIVALALVIGLLGFLMVLRRLTEPLHDLVQGTEALAAGDLGYRLAVSGNDEFAHIATRFNHMAQEINRHRGLLEDARSSLEQTVVERTEELRCANEALNRTDKIRRQFFADISHELRTPLTVIRGEAQIALRGRDKSVTEYKDALQRVFDQAEQLRRHVDDLLFIARSDAGAARIRYEVVALESLLAQVCADVGVVAEQKNIYIKLHVAVKNARITGDWGRLRQLFLILLENAIRYSKPASQVLVNLNTGIREVLVRITDTGIGIPADEIDLVFERFYRGENAVAMLPDGSGLGLPVARAIVHAHDGHIGIDSTVGEGTTVIVSLPVTRKLQAVDSKSKNGMTGR